MLANRMYATGGNDAEADGGKGIVNFRFRKFNQPEVLPLGEGNGNPRDS